MAIQYNPETLTRTRESASTEDTNGNAVAIETLVLQDEAFEFNAKPEDAFFVRIDGESTTPPGGDAEPATPPAGDTTDSHIQYDQSDFDFMTQRTETDADLFIF